MTAPVLTLSAVEVAAYEEAVRADLAGAVAGLRILRTGRAWEAAGFPTWGAYVLARFGDLLDQLRLAVEDRRAVVHELRAAGESQRAIADRLHVSKDTVGRDLTATGDPAPERILGRDGADRAARTGKAEPPTGKLWQQAAEHLRRRGEKGLTLVELARAMRITEGSASGLLTYLTGPRKRLAVRTEERRAGQRVHVAVAGQ